MTFPALLSALEDRYRIERELGAGGMATVYLAHDLKHDRKVAIKVLKPELAADRFVVEIKTTAALQRPYILPLFDSGEAARSAQYVDATYIAEVYTALGERDAAFKWLEQALVDRSALLRLELWWRDPLRSDARMAAFQMRVPAAHPAPL